MKSIFFLFGLLLTMSVKGQENVSIIEVLANKELYHNKLITMKGYMDSQKEGRAIYLSKEDYQYGIRKNAIFIFISKEDLERFGINRDWITGYIEIQGYFDSKRNGSYNYFNGSLMDIQNIQEIKRVNTSE